MCLATFGAVAQAPGDIRVALVIGNSAYTSAPALLNPSNDAKAMGETLRGLGFRVVELRDGSKTQMAEAIGKVRDSLKGKQGIGMLYYAGHGLQVDARNYMVPVDAKMGKSADVAPQTVDVSSVIDAFKAAGNRMNILVLDACRDNPFGGITTGKGLAPLDAPSGTFLAYATAPGNVAEDGDVKTGNGLYTQYLLQELKKPQARIEDVFKRVRFAVRKASSGRQIPWESTSLEDDFQFNNGDRFAPPKASAPALVASFNEEKLLWDKIQNSQNPDDFYAFLQKYPNGTISEAANTRLNRLTQPTLVVQGAGASGGDQTYLTRQPRVGDELVARFDQTIGPNKSQFTITNKVERIAIDEMMVRQRTDFTDGRPTVNADLRYDADGGIKSFDGGVVSPPLYLVPSGLYQVGRSWKIGYNVEHTGDKAITSHTTNGTAKMTARETIMVPAGTFQTFRVETETITRFRFGAVMIERKIQWRVPDVRGPIKEELDVHYTSNAGVVVLRTHKMELIKLTLGS
ncbi:MAG: caspase family protein [Candidatus Saccharibacteria bacterium]|nr:caspase family protein [Rhodoferax sp.]